MADALSLTWQPSLFGFDETPGLDASFRTLEHIQLDASAWVEHAPGWLSGSDRVFELILEGREWQQRSRQMYDRRVRAPHLPVVPRFRRAPRTADLGGRSARPQRALRAGVRLGRVQPLPRRR